MQCWKAQWSHFVSTREQARRGLGDCHAASAPQTRPCVADSPGARFTAVALLCLTDVSLPWPAAGPSPANSLIDITLALKPLETVLLCRHSSTASTGKGRCLFACSGRLCTPASHDESLVRNSCSLCPIWTHGQPPSVAPSIVRKGPPAMQPYSGVRKELQKLFVTCFPSPPPPRGGGA